jgi:hypothetical protein
MQAGKASADNRGAGMRTRSSVYRINFFRQQPLDMRLLHPMVALCHSHLNVL